MHCIASLRHLQRDSLFICLLLSVWTVVQRFSPCGCAIVCGRPAAPRAPPSAPTAPQGNGQRTIWTKSISSHHRHSQSTRQGGRRTWNDGHYCTALLPSRRPLTSSSPIVCFLFFQSTLDEPVLSPSLRADALVRVGECGRRASAEGSADAQQGLVAGPPRRHRCQHARPAAATGLRRSADGGRRGKSSRE